MKLTYSHSGLQFFFLTLTVEGREKILSKLVDEKTRPALTEVGEIVKAALLALHLVNEAVTVSDFVIMPDHLHFIMIIDYGRSRTASPLYLANRLIDAVEKYLERTGLRPEPHSAAPGNPEPSNTALGNVATRNAALGAPEPHGTAPGSAVTRETMAALVNEAIAAETAAWRSGKDRPEPRRVFSRDCYIELSFDSRQLKAVRRYIKLNPARALWKLRHPDRFRRIELPAEKLIGSAPNAAPRGSGLPNDPPRGSGPNDSALNCCPTPCRRATTPRPKIRAKSPQVAFCFSAAARRHRRYHRWRFAAAHRPPMNFAATAWQ